MESKSYGKDQAWKYCMAKKMAQKYGRKMAGNVVRKMAGNMVPKNGGKMCWHGADAAPALAGNTLWRKKWRENMEGKMAGNVVRKMAGNMFPKKGGKMCWHGVEAAPALVFFLRWKCGLVKVFMAARRPTLLILRVRDTDRLSFIPSMVERRLAL